jgi:hypothetical protein
MSVAKWTGKGLQLLGRILAAEEFERWLQSEGERYLTEALKNTSVNWLFGEARARSKLFGDVSESLNSDTFRPALQERLEKLPSIVADFGEDIKLKSYRLNLPVESTGSGWITVVPRLIVQRRYVSYLIKELGESAELARLQGFPSLYLRAKANDSEDAFFTAIKHNKKTPPPAGGLITGVDDNFDWHLGEVIGHYYYASTTFFSSKEARKKLDSDVRKLGAGIRTHIGALSVSDVTKISTALRKEYSSELGM